MAYCTAANVRARLPIFPADEEHDAIVAEAIEAAQTDVDAALSARYDVPFVDPAPPVIRHITADLAAAWTLDTTFSGGGEEKETKLSDSIRTRALDRLKKMAEGTWSGGALTSRDSVPGHAARPGILTSTRGQTPVLRDWTHPGLA